MNEVSLVLLFRCEKKLPRERILCIQPIVYNNTHCPSCMVSNPSPFRAALKILGILPYSLLLVDLIFFSPALRIS